MFLRTTRVKRPEGRVDEYIRLVESYWNQGRPRHRIVCNLGRKDVLAPHAEALLGLLQGEPPVGLPEAQAVGAWDWGPLLVARSLWRELGLEANLDRIGPDPQLSDRTWALVANRLTQPTSEHGLARWLETDFVCDRQGRRWLVEKIQPSAAGTGPRWAAQAMVSHPGSTDCGPSSDREGAVFALAGPVPLEGGSGLLRSDLELFRRAWAPAGRPRQAVKASLATVRCWWGW